MTEVEAALKTTKQRIRWLFTEQSNDTHKCVNLNRMDQFAEQHLVRSAPACRWWRQEDACEARKGMRHKGTAAQEKYVQEGE